MIVYISGQITNSKDFRKHFKVAENHFLSQGHVVLNPCILPEGLRYDSYMDIDMAMVRACDAVAMLPNWRLSKGACAEKSYAECTGKEIIYL